MCMRVYTYEYVCVCTHTHKCVCTYIYVNAHLNISVAYVAEGVDFCKINRVKQSYAAREQNEGIFICMYMPSTIPRRLVCPCTCMTLFCHNMSCRPLWLPEVCALKQDFEGDAFEFVLNKEVINSCRIKLWKQKTAKVMKMQKMRENSAFSEGHMQVTKLSKKWKHA